MKTPHLFLLPILFSSLATPSWTNPIDPEVIAGSVEFPEEFTDLLEITQHSDKAIIHWEGFSIDSGEITRFVQPGSSAAVLNRVVSGDTSKIEGGLQANGNVFLINPNGIFFGAGARVDVNGLVASTLDLPDAEFLAGGDMRFSGASQAPVVNLGEITAENGDVFLVGATVQNSGNINAPNGMVGLAAGQQVLITKQGEERVFVEVGSNGSVNHEGAIRAAEVELKAAGGNPKALAVNVAGRVEATGVQRVGGRVYLSGGGGKVRVAAPVRSAAAVIDSAEVEISAEANVEAAEIAVNADDLARIDGRLRARDELGNGGTVRVNGAEIAVGETGALDASGSAAAGLVEVIGGVSVASAGQIKARGDEAVGGLVRIQALDVDLAAPGNLDVSGTDGGFVSVESSGDVHVAGQLKARGSVGNGGLVIVRGDGDVDVAATGNIDASGEIDGGQVFVEAGGTATSSGTIKAKGRTGNGGFILVSGDEVTVNAGGLLDASGGVDGGFIHVQGDSKATVDGELRARGETGNGGMIHVEGDEVSVGVTGVLDASGAVDGGQIFVTGETSATIAGQLLARGGTGNGGFIQVSGDEVSVEATGLLDVSGGADGGQIFVEGGSSTSVDGQLIATGGSGVGGHIEVTGDEVSLGSTALLDATGAAGGGEILVGGDFQGANPNVKNAQHTSIADGAILRANSTVGGDAGRIIVWADGVTDFKGFASAAADGASGNGGFIEISGLGGVELGGTATVLAANGADGLIFVDPPQNVNQMDIDGYETLSMGGPLSLLFPDGAIVDPGVTMFDPVNHVVINAGTGGFDAPHLDITTSGYSFTAFGDGVFNLNNLNTLNGMAGPIDLNFGGNINVNNLLTGGGDIDIVTDGQLDANLITTIGTALNRTTAPITITAMNDVTVGSVFSGGSDIMAMSGGFFEFNAISSYSGDLYVSGDGGIQGNGGVNTSGQNPGENAGDAMFTSSTGDIFLNSILGAGGTGNGAIYGGDGSDLYFSAPTDAIFVDTIIIPGAAGQTGGSGGMIMNTMPFTVNTLVNTDGTSLGGSTSGGGGGSSAPPMVVDFIVPAGNNGPLNIQENDGNLNNGPIGVPNEVPIIFGPGGLFEGLDGNGPAQQPGGAFDNNVQNILGELFNPDQAAWNQGNVGDPPGGGVVPWDETQVYEPDTGGESDYSGPNPANPRMSRIERVLGEIWRRQQRFDRLNAVIRRNNEIIGAHARMQAALAGSATARAERTYNRAVETIKDELTGAVKDAATAGVLNQASAAGGTTGAVADGISTGLDARDAINQAQELANSDDPLDAAYGAIFPLYSFVEHFENLGFSQVDLARSQEIGEAINRAHEAQRPIREEAARLGQEIDQLVNQLPQEHRAYFNPETTQGVRNLNSWFGNGR